MPKKVSWRDGSSSYKIRQNSNSGQYDKYTTGGENAGEHRYYNPKTGRSGFAGSDAPRSRGERPLKKNRGQDG